MQKIISLFQRNYDTDRLVRDELTPGAEWVARGEGVATRKYDGTCCLVRGGKLFKRYEVKKGGVLPAEFEAASEVDCVTGKQQGWVPVGDGPEDQYHRAAWNMFPNYVFPDGTYELIGPKVQGNPENVGNYMLIPHGWGGPIPAPRDFNGIKNFLSTANIEGIVWHHPDGRMVKIKTKDFGLKRLNQSTQEGSIEG